MDSVPELELSAAAQATQRARTAFSHAVQRELEAIDLHESAALQADQAAVLTELRADSAADPARAAQLLEQAESDRGRAGRARERAEHARQRLRDDGIRPDR